MIEIRRAALYDLPGAYRVCLLTGDSGQDGSRLFRDPDLLGHVYVGPYIVGLPDTSLVAVDDGGVAGYLLAAVDTRAFEAWAEEAWWPALRERYPPRDDESPDGEVVRLIHSPARVPDEVVGDFPAHLHIDLLARARGRGFGKTLVEGLIVELRDRGVRGVHLDVAADNAKAIGFYRHLGFEPVDWERLPGIMGKRLG